MRYIGYLMVYLLASLAPLLAQNAPVRQVASPIQITHVTVIDTESGQEAHDRTVVISGDRISEVGKSARAPYGAKIVDGTGKYLIPGLWDMHVHTWDSESTYPSLRRERGNWCA